MDKKKDLKGNKAVALSYKEGYNAPKVVAKGKGIVADNIIERAKEKDVHIYKDEELVDQLMKLDLNEEIPPSLYEAVSKIILFVYQLDKEKEEMYEKQY
jgi:flagellar biosynthesis protein